MILDDIAIKYGTDKSTEDHSYTLIYESIFLQIRNLKLNILEIGVDKGYSAQTWLEYFPNSNLYCMDYFKDKYFDSDSKIDDVRNLLESDRCKVIQGDQSNVDDLNKVIEMAGHFDIIIDDGSHVNEDQQLTLATLFPYLKSGGSYFIEDLKCKRKPNPNLPKAKNTVDVFYKFIKTKQYHSAVSNNKANEYISNNISECKFFCKDRLLLIRK